MEHALGYAEGGYPLVPRICQTAIETRAASCSEDEWASSAERSICRAAEVPAPGSLFRNRDLAATWRRLLDAAEAGRAAAARRRSRRRGAPGARASSPQAIDDFCRTSEVMDTSGRRHRGLLTGADLGAWQATVEAPAHPTTTHGWTVCKCGPWSQGPVFLQQLALLEGFDLAAMDPLGTEFVHTVAECAKLAFADREAWYGDPDFVDGAARDAAVHRLHRGAPQLRRPTAPRLELRPGPAGAGRLGRGGAPAGRHARPAAPGRRRRADPRPGAALPAPRARRHLPCRRRRPLGQHDLGDAERRLAAELAGHPRARLLPRNTRARCSGLDADSASALGPRRRPRTTLTPSLRAATRRPRAWPSAPRAATSRTSGRRSSSCAMCITA
jgi:gamma-glutamyltranspeptidase/glutathione hydrolase